MAYGTHIALIFACEEQAKIYTVRFYSLAVNRACISVVRTQHLYLQVDLTVFLNMRI